MNSLSDRLERLSDGQVLQWPSYEVVLESKTGVYGYYVSVVDGPRFALLAGPVESKERAESYEGRVRELACAMDSRAVFYAYGISRIMSKPETFLPDGKFNKELGIIGRTA